MVYQPKPSSKALGKRPARNNTTTTPSSQSTYTPSRDSSAVDGDADESNGPPALVNGIRERSHSQKRVLPSRTRRGGPGAGIGQGEVDLSILDIMRKGGEIETLIPSNTIFILTTNSKFVPVASSSGIGLNGSANERFFDRPEVMRAFKEQQDIQIPEFTQLTEEESVGGRLRARSGGTGDIDLSDTAYEKRHRKHELAEKRQRLREKEKLVYEHFKLKERIEQLRTVDANAFMILPSDIFEESNSSVGKEVEDAIISATNEVFHEGESRRRQVLKAAEVLEARYRALLPDKRAPEKDRYIETPSASISPSIADGEERELDEGAINGFDRVSILSSNKPKSIKLKLVTRERAPTAPPMVSPYRTNRVPRVLPTDQRTTTLFEHQPEAESITIIASHAPSTPRSNASTGPTSPVATRLSNVDEVQRVDLFQNTIRGHNLGFDKNQPEHRRINGNKSAMAAQEAYSYSPLKSHRISRQSDKQIIAPELDIVVNEQQRIQLDDIPAFSPTASFPTMEYLSHISDIRLSPPNRVINGGTTIQSDQAALVARLEGITLSSREGSASQPIKRRPGRPRKHKPPEVGQQGTQLAIVLHAQTSSPLSKRRAATAPVAHMHEYLPEDISQPSKRRRPDVVSEEAYITPSGPGRHPPIPCILAASKHNVDKGRKSGRSVKAFGVEVPPFEPLEGKEQYMPPIEILEEIREARNGPGYTESPEPEVPSQAPSQLSMKRGRRPKQST